MFDDPDAGLIFAPRQSRCEVWCHRLILLCFFFGVVLGVFLIVSSARAEPLKPFTTDGCSGGLSASYRALFHKSLPYESCCVAHDRVYWQGGTADDRKRADKALYLCVKTRGYPTIAAAMWAAVRPGGVPFMRFDWRWGYGRDFGTSYWYDRPGAIGN